MFDHQCFEGTVEHSITQLTRVSFSYFISTNIHILFPWSQLVISLLYIRLYPSVLQVITCIIVISDSCDVRVRMHIKSLLAESINSIHEQQLIEPACWSAQTDQIFATWNHQDNFVSAWSGYKITSLQYKYSMMFYCAFFILVFTNSLQAHEVVMTSYWRRCDVLWRQFDGMYSLGCGKYQIKETENVREDSDSPNSWNVSLGTYFWRMHDFGLLAFL